MTAARAHRAGGSADSEGPLSARLETAQGLLLTLRLVTTRSRLGACDASIVTAHARIGLPSS
jgi:hypothetical protein